MTNGDRVSWNTNPLTSALSFSLQSDLHISGDLTRLKGRVSATAGKIAISDLSGVAAWSLLRTAIPDLRMDCDLGVRLQAASITLANDRAAVSGNASTSAGTCRIDDTAKAFEAPATTATATTVAKGSRVSVALASDPAALLAEVMLDAAGDVKATVQPLALKLIPGANASGPVEYEMRGG